MTDTSSDTTSADDAAPEGSAERTIQLMQTDLTKGLDDVLSSLQAITDGGGRVALTGGNLIERELQMAVSLSEQVRDSIFSAEALDEARAQPLNARLRSDGHRVVDLLADVGGVTVQGAVQAFHGFYAQRTEAGGTETPTGADQAAASAG